MRFIINKAVYALLVITGVVILIFVMFQGLGDPVKMMVGQTGNQATLQNIRKDLNLDEPGWKQLFLYINDVSPVSVHTREEIDRKGLKGYFSGDNTQFGIKTPYLGRSYQTRRPVTDVLMEALPGTLILALAAMLVACIGGISLGIVSAIKKDTWIDNSAILTSIAGVSAPSFFMAIIIAYVLGILLHPYTGLNFTGSLYAMDDVTGEKYLSLKNLILPAITLGIRPLAIITQLTRSSMLDVLNQDYIRTAYAKGLKKRRIILKHALPNALNPVITAITGWMAELLAGAFFIEYIFGWNGIGKITVDALEKLDYPVVMGSVLLSACIFVLINILADIIYSWIDPRISRS